MNILLVDDDLDVIEGIMDGVDWEGLGFRQVYLAQSAKRAREILQEQDVSVLLTDIEMPGGSGLELLEWVRDNQLDVVTLFYTSFASFFCSFFGTSFNSLQPKRFCNTRACGTAYSV